MGKLDSYEGKQRIKVEVTEMAFLKKIAVCLIKLEVMNAEI